MKKKIQRKSIRHAEHLFTVVLEPAEEGGYHVYCPALQGCRTEGDSFEEAMKNIQDAVTAYCDSLRKHGEPIPKDDLIVIPKAVGA